MFARNVQWAALLLFAFAVYTSCSQQDELAGEAASGEEIVTTVGVSVPELFKTRTDVLSDVYGESATTPYLGTSGMPSIGNVDLTAHPLTFTVGVYVKKKKQNSGDSDEYVLVGQQSHTATDDNAYFEFRLLKNQNYRLVAYADFNAGEKENLESIPMSYTSALNDELSDAFFASEEFVAAENVQVVLKRPFGKLRLIARDFNTLAAGGACKINKVTVKYYRQPMLATDTFNALTGEFNYDAKAQGDHTVEAVPVAYELEYNTADGKAADGAAVFTMYLPANHVSGKTLDEDTTPGLTPDEDHVDKNDIPESYMYPFDVTVEYENANTPGVHTIERSYTIDIPVKRNWLTTVDATHFWTGKSGVMVTVHAAFDGEIKYGEPEQPTVKNAADLQAEIERIFGEAPDGKYTERTIVLGANIDATDRVGFNLYNLKENGNDRSNRGVKIHLDLNGYTITTNGTEYPNWVDDEGVKHVTVGGLFHVQGVNCHLYIDDTSGKDPVGGLVFEGDAQYAYPLVCCHNGGQATINRGNFISTSPAEAIYVYESEAHRFTVQRWILSSLGIKKGSTAAKPTDDKTLAKIESNVKKWSASVTINGGWFENGYTGPIDDKKNVLINDYNARETKWDSYKDVLPDNGYPDWTSWGKYVNQPFGFMFVNGGSFVGFDPSKGDNIVGNIPNKWIGKGHVQQENIDDKTVYTIIPEDEVQEF